MNEAVEPRRPRLRLFVPLLALTAACAAAGFAGLVGFGALGGAAIGVAPERTFALVKPIVCAGDAQLEFTAIRRSYHRPGESEPHLICVNPDGSRRDVLLPAIAAILGAAFVAIFAAGFLLVLVPAAAIVWLAGARRHSDPQRRG